MSSNQINSLALGTINGLNSLALDELTTTSLTAGTMDGNLFYIDRIEANEVIVDTQLRLTNTGVFSVGAVTISDIELTYLDGVSSNIQTQINNINTNTSGLTATVNQHTTQIAALEASDATQNTTLTTHTSQISAIQTVNTNQDSTLSTHTSQISAIQTVNTNQDSTLSTHTSQISALQSSDGTQNTNITNLQNSVTNLQTSDATQNTNITNLQTSVTNLQTSDSTQNTNITNLQSKTQNISSANATSTNMSKPIYLTTSTGEGLRLLSLGGFISSYTTDNSSRYWYIGQPTSLNEELRISNEGQDTITLWSGKNGSGNQGQQKILTRSQGITLDRGGITAGDAIVNIGQIGGTNGANNVFHILGAGTNDIYMDALTGGNISFNVSGTRAITANTNVLWVGSSTANANGRKSNINMYNSAGTAWETQSSAFTEALKTQIGTNQTNIASLQTSVTSLQNARTGAQTAIARINVNTGNVSILGRTTTLTASFNYPTTTTLFSLGTLLFNNGYSAYFNSSGQWIYNSGATQRVNFQFDMTFNAGATGIKAMVMRILFNTSGGAALFQSRPMGVRYNQGGGNPLNTTLYLSTGNVVYDIASLNTVTLETENFFSTSADGASVTTTGRLTFYLTNY